MISWRRFGACASSCASAIAALIVTGSAGAEPLTGRAHISATALSPAGGGWTEVRITLQAGGGPWHGSLALGGQGAKISTALAIPAHGQRVVALPFWINPGESMPRIWLDGAGVGTVAARNDVPDRVLVVDSPRGLPAMPRAYEPVDLVVISADAAERLPPGAASALDAWVRWGGAAAVVHPASLPQTHRVGSGAAIVAASAAEARTALDRLRNTLGRQEDTALTILRGWERSHPPAAPSPDWSTKPGGRLAVLLGVYVGLLGAVGLVTMRFPTARRGALNGVLLLVLSTSIVVWGIARAGGSEALDVHERALIAARPDGEATLLSSALRMRAQRRHSVRWTSSASATGLYEIEPRPGRGDPQRAVRWDVDGVWSREWSIGETAVIRLSGIWRDLGIRAHALHGTGWRVENHGRYTLQAVVVLSGDGSATAVEDLPPSGVARIEARSSSRTLDLATPFWTGLLSHEAGAMDPVLLARLDPPIFSIRVLDRPVRASSETHLVLALPPTDGAAR